MNYKKILLAVAVCALAFPVAGWALTFDPDAFKADASITDDLYTASDHVTIDKAVRGDLIAAGGQAEIKAPISQDLALVGGKIDVEAEIGDDARLAGGDVEVNSTVKGDLLVGGGNITLGPSGFVHLDTARPRMRYARCCRKAIPDIETDDDLARPY